MFRGIIFDLDGVITDTAQLHYQAWNKLAQEENLYFDESMNEQLKGVSRAHSLDIILGDRHYSNAEKLNMMERKNHYYVSSLNNITQEDILPGISNLLIELSANRIKIGLASASKNARTILNRLGLISLFDGISDGYSVSRSKPNPDVFIHAAGILGLNTDDCIVIEDAQAGVIGAQSAGMRVVGVGSADQLSGVNFLVGKTQELTLANLKAM